jgi:LysM repeat protein
MTEVPINPVVRSVHPVFRTPGPARPHVGLAKAQLIDTVSQVAYPVMYNPEELKLEQGNTFAEVGIPGLNNPPLQYVRGKSRTLSMELFFDSYESGHDVRDFTTPIVRLLDKLPQTLGPPVLLFSMGRLQFECVLVDAAQRFTMFTRDGTPARCTMSVRLQEYVRVDIEIQRGLFFGSPTLSAAANAVGRTAVGRAVVNAVRGAIGSVTVHVVIPGDTLSGLAGAYLGDPTLWRDIARANGITDPLNIPAGTSLVIPTSAATAAPGGIGVGGGPS